MEAFLANVTPRYRHIDNLEKWVDGKQYEGMADWFSDASFFEKAPCVVYQLTKSSIESKRDLVLGEGHFPFVTTSPDEDDTEESENIEEGYEARVEGKTAPPPSKKPNSQAKSFSEDNGLNEEDSEEMDRLIEKIAEESHLESTMCEAIEEGQGAGTAVILFGVRDGRLFTETVKAKWCTPTFDASRKVISLKIEYPYLDVYEEREQWRVRAMMYRRIIDSWNDITFYPVELRPGQKPKESDWTPRLSVAHGLGECPVHWYPFMRGCSAVNEIDGRAVHEQILDEQKALDQTLSQRHRAVIFGADPQWTECGVTPGYSPTESESADVIQGTMFGGKPGPNNPLRGRYKEPGSHLPARKKGPGEVWQYPDPNTNVEMHTLPGDAVTASNDHASDLRMKLCELLAYVPLDPDSIKGLRTISGKALAALRKRETNRCNAMRRDFGDNCLIPSIKMLLRIALKIAQRGKGALRTPGINRALPILSLFVQQDPDIRLVWGSYEEEDSEDEDRIVKTTVAALMGGLITLRMAVQKISKIYGIENVDQAVARIEFEKQQF